MECNHPQSKVQSMRRNGTWRDAPSYPMKWAGVRPSVRAVCVTCGTITIPPKPHPER